MTRKVTVHDFPFCHGLTCTICHCRLVIELRSCVWCHVFPLTPDLEHALCVVVLSHLQTQIADTNVDTFADTSEL